MTFDISSITKSNGASINMDFTDVLACSRLPEDIELSGPVKFRGTLTNVNGILKLDGILEADYDARCNRCLKSLKGHLKLKVNESFMREKPEEDSDAYTYEGNWLELDSVFEDNIILNIPMQQLCSENCKGLCPKCGANLNEAGCNCSEDYINPQMELLKNLLNN